MEIGSKLLADKNAIITGCSRGIGKAIMELFAENGANIWACARKPSSDFSNNINFLSSKYGVSITPVYFDLIDYPSIKDGVKTILETKKDIDILVNNAGIVSENSLFQMTSIEKMRQVFEINFFSQILVTQYIIRRMVKQKSGSIINISSIAGIDGDPGQLEYCASKAAMIGATKKLANDFSKHNIRVNAVAPGITETDMINEMNDETMQRFLNNSNMKRCGQPHEIAQVVLFLASNMSSFITGQVLRADGGI